jgi:hypothetical protein
VSTATELLAAFFCATLPLFELVSVQSSLRFGILFSGDLVGYVLWLEGSD